MDGFVRTGEGGIRPVVLTYNLTNFRGDRAGVWSLRVFEPSSGRMKVLFISDVAGARP